MCDALGVCVYVGVCFTNGMCTGTKAVVLSLKVTVLNVCTLNSKAFRNVWITIHSSSYSVPSWIRSCQKWSIIMLQLSLNYSPLLPLFSAELLFLRGRRKSTPSHPSSSKDDSRQGVKCQTTLLLLPFDKGKQHWIRLPCLQTEAELPIPMHCSKSS